MPFDYRPALHKQLSRLHARLAAGMPRRGWKVGINVPEVQRRVGLSGPIFAWLDGDRVAEGGAPVELPPGARMHAEPEACLKLGADVTANMDAEQARAAVQAIAPAIEFVDYAKPADDIATVVETSMYHSACALGAFWPAPGDDALDVAKHVQLRAGRDRSEPARGDLVPPDPGEIVLRLARLLEEMGEQLRAGDLVLSGSFTVRAVPIGVNQVAEADFGPLGSVQCKVVAHG